MILGQYKPLFFITLTWKGKVGRDDIEIEVRKYISRLARINRGHIKKKVGIEWGDNSHAHIVVWSLDINPYKVDKARFKSRKMFPFGKVDFQIYDPLKAQSEYGKHGAVFYTIKHTGINDADEVFCGSRKRSCVRGRCVERQKVASHNARLRLAVIEKMRKTG